MNSNLRRLGNFGIAAFFAVVVVAPLHVGVAYAIYDTFEEEGLHASSVPQLQEDEDADPEANLPYFFAVYIITWAGFFAFVFFMSRRQREMKRDIETLGMALADKRRVEAMQGRERPSS